MALADMGFQKIEAFFANLTRPARLGGMTQAILDAETQPKIIEVSQAANVRNGKVVGMRAHYYPIDCDAAAVDCTSSSCDDPAPTETDYMDFMPDGCLAVKPFAVELDTIKGLNDFSINEQSALHGSAANVSSGLFISGHLASIFQSKIQSMYDEFDKRLVTTMAANVGNNYDGNATKIINLTNDQGGINQMGVNEIYRDFSDLRINNPYIVGTVAIDQWQRYQTLAATNNGVNFQNSQFGNLYYDRFVDSTGFPLDTTHNNVLAFDPALVKLVMWSENQGKFATDLTGFAGTERMFYQSSTGKIYGSILDTNLNAFWDFEARATDCPDKWVVSIKLRYKLLTLPAQVCATGATGILRYQTCKPAAIVCP